MNATALFLMSLTVAFPAIAGLIRLLKMERSFYPFIIYLVVSLLNELLVGIFLKDASRATRLLDWHLFNLFEGVIFLVQFYAWNIFRKQHQWLIAVGVVLVGIWLVENFITGDTSRSHPVYPIGYSFVLLLLSVQTIHYLVTHENRQPLYKNARFIICVTLAVYFIYNIFVLVLLLLGSNAATKKLMAQIFEIRVYVNALSNIVLGIAVLYIPRKKNGSTLFEAFDNNRPVLTPGISNNPVKSSQ